MIISFVGGWFSLAKVYRTRVLQLAVFLIGSYALIADSAGNGFCAGRRGSPKNTPDARMSAHRARDEYERHKQDAIRINDLARSFGDQGGVRDARGPNIERGCCAVVFGRCHGSRALSIGSAVKR